VTGVEVVIENCHHEVHKILPDLRNWEKNFPIMVDDACCIIWCCYTSTHAFIWQCCGDMVPQTYIFWGHVTSSFTWPFDWRGSTSYGWSIVTMRLSSTVMKIWSFKFFQTGSSRNRGRSLVSRRSVVGRSSILHWSRISSSLRWKCSAREVTRNLS